MKAAVITFPGSNRDGDVAKALKQAGAEVAHVWHADTELPRSLRDAHIPHEHNPTRPSRITHEGRSGPSPGLGLGYVRVGRVGMGLATSSRRAAHWLGTLPSSLHEPSSFCEELRRIL